MTPQGRLSISLGIDSVPISITELRTLTHVPHQRMNPLRHDLVSDWMFEWASENDLKIRDTFNTASKKGARYVGLFQFVSPADLGNEIDWVIAAKNYNDGMGAFELHSGIAIRPFWNTLVFHESKTILRKYGYTPTEEVHSLVNETLGYFREFYGLESERMESYKNWKISQKEGHDIICKIILNGIMGGSRSLELIQLWNKRHEYLKPSTLWSLYVMSAWLLDRLRASEVFERTMDLQKYFDSICKFSKKPTAWVQTRFA